MDIQLTSVLNLTLTLSETEAREILADPEPFQDELRKTLADHHAGGNGHLQDLKAGRPFGSRLTSVLNLTLTLSEAEAREILADPAPFQAQLRKTLAGHHAGSNGPLQELEAKRPFGSRRPARVAARSGQTHRRKSTAQATCPECGKPFAARGLGVHMAKRHPSSSAAPAAS